MFITHNMNWNGIFGIYADSKGPDQSDISLQIH